MTRLAGGLALLACLGLAACGVGGSSGSVKPTATQVVPTATATLQDGFELATSDDGSFQIAWPAAWQTATPSGEMVFYDPAGGAQLVIASRQVSLSDASIAANEAAFFKHVSSDSGGSGAYTVTSGPTRVSLAGETWTREEADITAGNGAVVHSVTLAANHGQSTYVITFIAPKSAYATYDAQDFEPMVQSFVFLK